MISKPNHHLFR